MATKEQISRYNKAYYSRLKAYKETHPDSPTVIRWRENARVSSEKRYAANIDLYSKDQKRIAEARKARGWTQKDLGEKLGVSLMMVCHWEKGRAKAPWDRLFEIMPELREGNYIV